jgi:hypothetical protein
MQQMLGKIYFSIDETPDGLIQLSINDPNGGYRICGPKYAGHSRTIKRHEITARDVREIRAYLRQQKVAGDAR